MTRKTTESMRWARRPTVVAVLAMALIAGPASDALGAAPARDVYELDLPSIGASSGKLARSDLRPFTLGGGGDESPGSALESLTPGAAIAALGALAALAAIALTRRDRGAG